MDRLMDFFFFLEIIVFCKCIYFFFDILNCVLTCFLCSVSSAGRVWHTGRGGVAVGDPGQLRHAVVLPALPLRGQPAHRRGNHRHGDRLPGLRRRRQGEPADPPDCE